MAVLIAMEIWSVRKTLILRILFLRILVSTIRNFRILTVIIQTPEFSDIIVSRGNLCVMTQEIKIEKSLIKIREKIRKTGGESPACVTKLRLRGNKILKNQLLQKFCHHFPPFDQLITV